MGQAMGWRWGGDGVQGRYSPAHGEDDENRRKMSNWDGAGIGAGMGWGWGRDGVGMGQGWSGDGVGMGQDGAGMGRDGGGDGAGGGRVLHMARMTRIVEKRQKFQKAKKPPKGLEYLKNFQIFRKLTNVIVDSWSSSGFPLDDNDHDDRRWR